MKILVITSRLPYPLEKGDKLRIYHQMRILSQRHEVSLFALSDLLPKPGDVNEIQQICTHLDLHTIGKSSIITGLIRAMMKGWPLQIGYFFHPHIAKKLSEFVEKVNPDMIFCQLVRMSSYTLPASIPATLDYMDAFSLGMQRRAAESPWWQKPILSREAKKLLAWEKEIYSDFQYHTIISEQDKSKIALSEDNEITVVPNGVDTDFFSPQSKWNLEYDLVFVGNLSYFPNKLAARLLAQEIFPGLQSIQPQINLLLAGAEPGPEIKAYGQQKNISVSGWLEDIREAYAKGKLFVAPLMTGSGQQNKILEAMAMGKVCITTSIVNNAINAGHKKEIWVADTVEEFIKAIQILLKDEDLRENIGRQAREFILKNYSWEEQCSKLERIWGVYSQ